MSEKRKSEKEQRPGGKREADQLLEDEPEEEGCPCGDQCEPDRVTIMEDEEYGAEQQEARNRETEERQQEIYFAENLEQIKEILLKE